MESRNQITFKLIICFELVAVLVFLILIYIYRKDIKMLDENLIIVQEENKKKPQYNTEEINQEIEFYTNIETNLQNLYEEYYNNIYLLEKKIQNNETNVNYKVGDFIIHKVYGEGIIVSVEDTIGKICFTARGEIKTFDLTHPSIRKK